MEELSEKVQKIEITNKEPTKEEIQNMSKEEKALFAQKKVQQIIKEKLLKIGGEDVEFLEDTFSMQINIYKFGKLIHPLQPSILEGDDDDEAEISSFRIYENNKEFEKLQLLSGFALGKQDQVWKMHTWLQCKSNETLNKQVLEQNLDEENIIKHNKDKYGQIIGQIEEESKFDQDLVTIETTIEEIELYYGYIAQKDEINMRIQQCKQYIKEVENEDQQQQNDDDDFQDDEDDEDDWEDEGDE